MKYEAVLFDLDGTLVRTPIEAVAEMVNNTLSHFGREAPLEDITYFWYHSGRERIIEERFHVDPAEFWSLFKIYDTVEFRKKHAECYHDVGVVAELLPSEIKTGIVSGTPKYLIDFEVSLLGQNLFNAIVCANHGNGFKPKPDPHGLLECMRLLEVKPDRALSVGNAREDVDAANAARMDVALILRGECKFPGINPTYAIEDLYGLRPIVGIQRCI